MKVPNNQYPASVTFGNNPYALNDLTTPVTRPVVCQKLRQICNKIYNYFLLEHQEITSIIFSPILPSPSSGWYPLASTVVALLVILCQIALLFCKIISLPYTIIPFITNKILERRYGTSVSSSPSIQLNWQQTPSPLSYSLPSYSLPPYQSQENIETYIQQVNSSLQRPLLSSLEALSLAPADDTYHTMIVAETQNLLGWGRIRKSLAQAIRNLPGTEKEMLQCSDHSWDDVVLALSRYCEDEDEDVSKLSQASLQLLAKTLKHPDISPDRKWGILKHVMTYIDKCPPTWVKIISEELQAIYNTQGTIPNYILALVQQFKENLLKEICADNKEWHIISVVKHLHGNEIGLNNLGVVPDQFTQSLIAERTASQTNEYRLVVQNLKKRYLMRAEQLIDVVLNNFQTGSDELQANLNKLLVEHLEEAGVPPEGISEVMASIFFTEENDYQPSRELVAYLLLHLGIVRFRPF